MLTRLYMKALCSRDIAGILHLSASLHLLWQDQEGAPVHAMPSIAAHLREQGLLPKWVERLLLTQPALFDRAFERLFAQVCTRTSA